jgi:flagellar basal body rod protein FlgC
VSIDLLTAAASAMDSQRAALDIAARNVAAAQAAGPNGSYPRLVPEFSVVDDAEAGTTVELSGSHIDRGSSVDVLTEMIAAMNASRSYEADASIFDVGKTLAEKTIALEQL